MGGKQSSDTRSDQGAGDGSTLTQYRPDDSPVVTADPLNTESLQQPAPSLFSTTPPPLPPPPRPPSSPSLSQRPRPSTSSSDLPRPRFSSAGQHRQPAAASDNMFDWDFLLSDFPRPPPLLPPLPPPPPRLHSASHHRMHHSVSSHAERERRSRRRAEMREQLGISSSASGLDSLSLLLRGLARTEMKCPVCHEDIPSGEFQRHLTECARRQPKLQYNEDVLRINSGECSICLEDMTPGDAIARLPCLCVYHVKCLEEWFQVKQTCPEHPDLKS